ERGEDRLDQYGAANRSRRHAERLLGERERLRPEPRLEVALELRQVEVRTAPALEQLRGVVVHDEAEAEEAGRDRFGVDLHVPLGGIERGLPLAAPVEQLAPRRAELVLQQLDELERALRQNLFAGPCRRFDRSRGHTRSRRGRCTSRSPRSWQRTPAAGRKASS